VRNYISLKRFLMIKRLKWQSIISIRVNIRETSLPIMSSR